MIFNLKLFEKTIRNLSLALSFFMQIYPNLELLGKQNEEKIEEINSIKNKEGALNEIEKKINQLAKKALEETNTLKEIEIYEEILRLLDENYEPQGEFFANVLSLLGSYYYDEDQLIKAESSYRRALEIRKKDKLLNEKPSFKKKIELDIAEYLYSLAQVLSSQFKNIEAESSYIGALEIRKKFLGVNNAVTADSLSSLGYFYSYKGLYKKAESMLLQSLKIRKKVLENNHYDIGQNYNALGTLYAKQGFYSKAESNYIKALSIYKINDELSDTPDLFITYLQGKVLINLGSLYLRQRFNDKALEFTLRGIEKTDKYIDTESSAVKNQLNTLALIYQNLGNFSKAEDLFLRNLKIIEDTLGKNNQNYSYALTNLAQLYEDQGLYKKSASMLKRGLILEFLYIQKEVPYMALAERELFLKTVGRNYESSFPFAFRGSYGKRLALFTRLNRQGLLEDIEKRQSNFSSLTTSQQKIIEKIKELNQKLASYKLQNSQKQNFKKQKEILEKKLYLLFPEFKAQIVEVEQVAKAIPDNGILIEYQRYQPFNSAKSEKKAWGDARFLALILNPNGKIESIDLGLAAPIEEKIKKALISSEEGLEDADQLWEDVSSLVIKPLENIIGTTKTLFISPDGELNRIPFAALSLGLNKVKLSDNFNIRLLTTGRELLNLALISKTSKQKPLVVANPNFNTFNKFLPKKEIKISTQNLSQKRSGDLASFNWNPLPGTAKEGKVISELIQAELLTNNAATVLEIQERKAPKILHISSHAYFLSDKKNYENQLLRSGVVLAGANEPELNPNDDGYLTALEITNLDLDGTDLFVISGCDSGIGDFITGSGVYGLKRAIAVAGARSSLLSLWKVNDNATAAFMEAYYTRLKEGEGRAKALANTQKAFREHIIPGFRHPGVWAAFQLSGDWRPIDF